MPPGEASSDKGVLGLRRGPQRFDRPPQASEETGEHIVRYDLLNDLALLWRINGLVTLIVEALRSVGGASDGGLEFGADGLAEAVR